MAAHKQLLIELLEEEQEPFHLKGYIAERRSQFNKWSPATTLQLSKRKPVAQETAPKSGGFCFYSLRRSPDVSNPSFIDFQSPAMSPCKSPISPVFLRVPPRTAELLVEAAMRIQKRRQSQVRVLGFGLFGAFLKRLKDRNKHKKRAIGDKEINILGNCQAKLEDEITFNRGGLGSCGGEQSEETNDRCSLREALLCSNPASPFRFSFHRSASTSGRRTPELYSFTSSPSRRSQLGEANSQTRNPNDAQGEEDEEQKKQCSPVSVLDSFLEDEDDEHGSIEPEGEDSDHYISYANVQRVKQQLLYRLQRFEKLAELDPVELEKRLLESNSDDECLLDSLESSREGEPFSPCRDEDIELEVYNQSSHNSSETKTLFSGKSIVWGRVCKKLESWKEMEFIGTLVELDVKNECDGWRKFYEQVEEAVEEVEVAIMGLLVGELLQEGASTDY